MLNEESVEKMSQNLKNIVKYNHDREEKDRLFQNKVDELKNIFEKQDLNNLKSLSFDFKPNKIQLEDVEEEVSTAGTDVIGKGK